MSSGGTNIRPCAAEGQEDSTYNVTRSVLQAPMVANKYVVMIHAVANPDYL